MIPPQYDAPDITAYQNGIGEALVTALENARVPRVVTLSSIGAHLFEGTGPIRGLHDMEKKLERLGDADVVHLRAAYFMETAGTAARHPGTRYEWSRSARRADPHGRGKDIGTRRGCSSQTNRGIPSVSPRPARSDDDRGRTILGRAIGKPDLRYVQFPEEEARKAMSGMGMSDSAIDALLEMQRGFNAGRIRPTQERNVSNTTPTTLEEFAETVFAQSYRAAV
jgi:hypothetical protein